MLNKLFNKELEINVGGQPISFNTLAEFEFCLSGRTDVPSRKMAELIKLSSDELKSEAKNIKAVEKRFVDILSKSIENPGTIGRFIRELDPKVFSQDHNWREIMASLKGKDEDYDELRKVALVKYMQYLTSRQEVIKQIYSVQRRMEQERGPSTAAVEEPVSAENGNGASANPAFRETVILDSTMAEPVPKRTSRYARLPKGEAVIVPITKDQEVEFLLSKHSYKLVAGDQIQIVDETGTAHPLQDGKNIVGRDTVCNVIVNPAYRDVSRLHLIIERIADDAVRMTDLSSHGTFLPPEYLEQVMDEAI